MISFHYEDTDFRFSLKLQKLLKKWLKSCFLKLNLQLFEVSYIFCSDEYLLHINQEYLNHDYYTDIITFDYGTNIQISSDMYISIDRVKENANELNLKFIHELARVMIHGVLHCNGYKDDADESELIMRKIESKLLQSFRY